MTTTIRFCRMAGQLGLLLIGACVLRVVLGDEKIDCDVVVIFVAGTLGAVIGAKFGD